MYPCIAKEYAGASKFLRDALHRPQDWIVADQVYFETYRLLRNPAVLAKPLSAREAGAVLRFYRLEAGFLHCAFQSELMEDGLRHLEKPAFAAARTFDVVLAATLKAHGVTEFYTRNRKDFPAFNWFNVVDPL